ncbi:ArsR/SmtB family transcription factor [Gorillibacterium massiliense]|uniref:ArsR/SmtB family transcription factor n=1 Tax=Gorillibacterium massiliense TaxID=1280390 RepID=UPI001EE1CEDE|nr:metalloregulator ArsR/SmtB family transcription factor [Gorillibacterium massiliense]
MSSMLTINRKLKTIVSPFHELICSLHVLYRPEHHPNRLQWAQELREKLPQPLKEAVNRIGNLSDGWTPLLDYTDFRGEPVPCLEGIEGLKKLPDAELAYFLLNGKWPLSAIITKLEKRGKASGNGADTDLLELDHFQEARQLLFTTLETYERDYFRREWEYIEPWLNASAMHFQEMAAVNPEKALNTLHPRLRAENGALSAQKASTYYFPYERMQHVYVFPSTFIFPHLLISWTETALCLPLSVDTPWLPFSEEPPKDLLNQLKALGDETRLRLMKLLWTGPHCTKQLAPVLGISEAAVSKQLKLLNEAGFTRAERKGSYIFYSANKEAMDHLLLLQRQYLEQ